MYLPVNVIQTFFCSSMKTICGVSMAIAMNGSLDLRLFFGSGKSHFLKILSYVLENREVKGIKAIDF